MTAHIFFSRFHNDMPLLFAGINLKNNWSEYPIIRLVKDNLIFQAMMSTFSNIIINESGIRLMPYFFPLLSSIGTNFN